MSCRAMRDRGRIGSIRDSRKILLHQASVYKRPLVCISVAATRFHWLFKNIVPTAPGDVVTILGSTNTTPRWGY
jgi:hypothetical protein